MLPFPNVGYVSCLEGITRFVNGKAPRAKHNCFNTSPTSPRKLWRIYVQNLTTLVKRKIKNGQLEMGLEKGTCYTSPLSMLESFLLKE